MAADLGFSSAFADQGTERLRFGALEPLVGVMQETPAARLIPIIVERLNSGTALRDVVAAAALANARTFGGEDYVGFHTMMAIAPAFHMAGELPEARRALPVLKVLFRNAARIQEFGGPRREVLHPVQAATLPSGRPGGEVLRDSVRQANLDNSERNFAALAGTADDALNNVLYAVQDGCEVHRIVLPYRAWDLMGIIGRENAHTLLRQSVHYCVRAERNDWTQRSFSGVRTLVPRLLDQHRLLSGVMGTRPAEDSWIDELSRTIFAATPERAADAAAAALAEGFDPAAVGEAITLAANQLVLRDNGRPRAEGPNKPAGSIHGDSIGVHACDSANAWRNLARVTNPRNRAVCLILGAWQVAFDRGNRGGEFLRWQPYPRDEHRELVRSVASDRILPALEDAIRNRDQVRAAALVHRFTESNQQPRPILDIMLRYAISEDGALHAEKFYRTVSEEYASTRPAFRARHLIALARVTASEHGYAAPGHADACRLLGV
jgi:hypothetical protein